MVSLSTAESAGVSLFSKLDWFDSFILRTLRDQKVIPFVSASLLIFCVIKVSQYLFFHFDTSPAIILSPVGIGLALVYLFGYRMWAPIALAWFLGTLTSPANPPLLLAALAALAYPLQATIGGYLLQRLNFLGTMDRARCAIILVCVALTLSAIAPSIVTGAQVLMQTLTVPAWVAWSRGWAGGVMSIMLFTPLITNWVKRQQGVLSRKEFFENIAALAALALTTYAVFWTTLPQLNVFIVLYMLFAVLFWIALRLRPRMTILALFITAALGIAGSVIAHPSATPLNQQLLADELFMILIAPIFLILAALVEERRVIASDAAARAFELEKMNRRLSLEDHAKNEFLAILAHELRNPLAPIVSSLELMKIKLREFNRPDMLEPIDIAQSHATILARLLDDLLDISRISRKKFKLERESIELHATIDQAIRTIEPLYTSQRHTLNVSISRKPIWLDADPLRIEQVLVNLLSNAAKYTDPGGRIDILVSSDKEKNLLRISVKDDGEGIESSMLGKIFEPFVRIHEGREFGSGLGIGLPLTKKLVELHGGEIWAESKGVGRGSEFAVVLPVSENVQLSLTSLPKGRRKASRKKAVLSRDVLVVDDNKAAAESICRLLELRGHDVSVAYDGPMALEKMRENEAEVVLLDIGLPGMDGYEVARNMRAAYGHNPLILVALTGYGQEEDKLKATQAGFDYHLTKPVGLADIEEVLFKGLRNS